MKQFTTGDLFWKLIVPRLPCACSSGVTRAGEEMPEPQTAYARNECWLINFYSRFARKISFHPLDCVLLVYNRHRITIYFWTASTCRCKLAAGSSGRPVTTPTRSSFCTRLIEDSPT